MIETAFLGLLASVVTEFIKSKKDDFEWWQIMLIVFGICLVLGILLALYQQYSYLTFFRVLASGFVFAISWYEIVIKRVRTK